jgi:nucleotide-binding universal stress UspA family protein
MVRRSGTPGSPRRLNTPAAGFDVRQINPYDPDRGTIASSAHRIASASTQGVFIMFKRILVPTDGSELTARAVTVAINLAKSLGASIYTLSVKEPFPYSAISEMQPVPPQEFFDAQERIAAERVNTVRAECKAAAIPCEAHTIEAVHPWEAIIEHAKNNACELIVMSSHGRRGVTALLLGSETQKVLTHSTTPVLVVR